MNDLTIKIIGKAGAGKSTLAFRFKKIMEEAGIQVEISGDEDDCKNITEERLENSFKSLSGKKVGIFTIQDRNFVK